MDTMCCIVVRNKPPNQFHHISRSRAGPKVGPSCLLSVLSSWENSLRKSQVTRIYSMQYTQFSNYLWPFHYSVYRHYLKVNLWPYAKCSLTKPALNEGRG